MTSALHVYPSVFTHDSRILRETKSLADAGIFDDIHIGAIWQKGLAEHEDLDAHRHVWRVCLWTARLNGPVAKLLRFAEWYARILWRFWRGPPDFVNCHSLSTLPLGWLLKRTAGSRIVYDTHELETETHVSVGVRRWLAKRIEKALLPAAEAVIVVSESIGAWYREAYGLDNVHVIRNVPYARAVALERSDRLRSAFGIKDEEFLFVYQGLLDHGRGIDILLKAFARASKACHIVFLGYGPLVQKVQRSAELCRNIHYHPAVSPGALAQYTAGADIGISLIENTSLSYYYALPNKVFEYLAAGVPIIVSDFPEMARIVAEHNCGWTCPVGEDAVVALVNGMSHDDRLAKRANAVRASESCSWEKEQAPLLAIYAGLIPSCASSEGLRR